MRIEIGKFAGFCDGVKYAVEEAFLIASKSNDTIYVDGKLIHNPQTLDMLESSGVKTYTDDLGLCTLEDRSVIIRAHGVSPERKRTLALHAKNVVDLTCKYVGRIQSIVKKHSNDGYRIIIIGNIDHPEIIGILGFASKADTYVVLKEESVYCLPTNSKKTLIVAQTTLEQKLFTKLSCLIKERYNESDIIVKNTICNATALRQNEVLEIAKRNDAVLIIGGKESSNTKNLYNIAKAIKPAFYVEYKEDLDSIDLSKYKKIGIMAGASTPDWLIEEVANLIKEKYTKSYKKAISKVLNFILDTYLSHALAGILLSFAVYNILSQKFNYSIALIVGLYYFSMSLTNGYTNYALKISDKNKYNLYKKNKNIFYTLIILSIITMIFLSYKEGVDALILTVFSILMGIAYNISFKNLKTSKVKYIKILSKLIPLKSLIISFAVTVLLNGLIFFTNEDVLSKDRILAFLFCISMVFLFMFMRQASIEIKSSQSDKIAGATGLTTYINLKHLITLTSLMPVVVLIAMIIGIIKGYYPVNFDKTKYFIPIIYSSVIFQILIRKPVYSNRYLFHFLIDTPLYLAGILALISYLFS